MFTHPDRQRKKRQQCGYTLLEVIAAMALLMFLIGGVYSVADGALRLGASLGRGRVSEARVDHFLLQWRDFLQNLPPEAVVDTGKLSVKQRLLITNGGAPFAWNRQVRLSDAVEFVLEPSGRVGGKPVKDLTIRHLRLSDQAGPGREDYELIAELPLMRQLSAWSIEFYDPEEEAWFSGWDAEARGDQRPLFLRLTFTQQEDGVEHSHVFWLAETRAVTMSPALESGIPSDPNPAPEREGEN